MNYYYIQNNYIHFKFDFNTQLIQEIKNVDGRKWNPETKEWYVPNSLMNSSKIKAIIEKHNFVCDSSSTVFKEVEIVNETNKDLIEVRSWVESRIKELNTKLTPRPYQIDGISFHILNKLVVNGSQMGLGKTAQALLAVECAELFPCLIICPACVKYNWAKEWNKWITGRTTSVIDGKTGNWEVDVVCINYDMLGKKEGDKTVLKFEELASVGWKSIVVDESHRVKNSKSIRSQALVKIAKGCDNIYLLTGTPILNRPNELINQLNIIRRFKPLFGDWMSFVKKFCNAHKTPFGWDTSGASNLPELYSILKKNTYFRVETKDVLKSLPERQDTVLNFSINNKKKYKDAVCDLILYLKNNKSVEASERAESAQHLVMLMVLRQLSSVGKIKEVEEWLEDYLESTSRNILVFGTFKETLQHLSTKFKAKLIDGSTSSKKKQETIDKLSRKDRILFGNIQSLGTGTDGLQHFFDDILILDLPDVPTLIEQAVARVHRDGVKGLVNVYFSVCEETIDKQIWEMLEEKREITEAVNSGKSSSKTFDITTELLRKFI